MGLVINSCFSFRTFMRVRKVQEIDIPDLSGKLLAARKAAKESLLEICRQLEITPTYWYKLEKGEASTINYDLLRKIEEVLSLDFNVRFSDASTIASPKEGHMELSRLKWIKVVTPPHGWRSQWAYSQAELEEMNKNNPKNPVISRSGLVVFPLGFRTDKARLPLAGDLIALTQHAKITHIVEVLDEEADEDGGWFNRYVKVIWWKPEIEMKWEALPHQKVVLGTDVTPMQGIPYLFTAFESFRNKWGDDPEGMKAFQEHLSEKLGEI
ncbi:MAG: helix-turn-helix domain-containing protein [Stenomitos frigidus ULC029]